MKKSSGSIPNAMEFEHVCAEGGEGWFPGSRLYAVEGNPGLFRRVPRSDRRLTGSDGTVVAHFGGTIIELVRYSPGEDEMGAAGFFMQAKRPEDGGRKIVDAADQPGPPLDVADGRSEAQLKADGDERWPDGPTYTPPDLNGSAAATEGKTAGSEAGAPAADAGGAGSPAVETAEPPTETPTASRRTRRKP